MTQTSVATQDLPSHPPVKGSVEVAFHRARHWVEVKIDSNAGREPTARAGAC